VANKPELHLLRASIGSWMATHEMASRSMEVQVFTGNEMPGSLCQARNSSIGRASSRITVPSDERHRTGQWLNQYVPHHSLFLKRVRGISSRYAEARRETGRSPSSCSVSCMVNRTRDQRDTCATEGNGPAPV
jgi:hypothetical protein